MPALCTGDPRACVFTQRLAEQGPGEVVISRVGRGAGRTRYEEEEFSITLYSSVLFEFCIVSIYDALIEIKYLK